MEERKVEEIKIEAHYRLGQIASKLNLGRETTRKILLQTSSVIKLRIGGKGKNTIYLTSESALKEIIVGLKTGRYNLT